MDRTRALVAAATLLLIAAVDLTWAARELPHPTIPHQAWLPLSLLLVSTVFVITRPWRYLSTISSIKAPYILTDDKLIQEGSRRKRAFEAMEVQDIREDTRDTREGYVEYKHLYGRFSTVLLTLAENKVPLLYLLTLASSSPGHEDEHDGGEESTTYETSIAIITFGNGKTTDEASANADKHALMIRSSLQTAFPSLVVKRLGGRGIVELKERFFPG